MAVPEVRGSVTDGALGQLPESTDNAAAVVGYAALATPLTIYALTQPEDCRALGAGPAPELAALLLSRGASVVYLCAPTSDVAGAMGAVTASGAGPTVTLTGAPKDAYQLIAKIITGGAVGTSTFQYSLDGGDTWSAVLSTASTYLVPDSGVTINFAAGTYVAADTYSATGTAPGHSNTNLGLAIQALIDDTREWAFLVDAGVPATAAAGATTSASVATKMATAESTAYEYGFAITQAADDTDANLIAAYLAVTSSRLMIGAGFAEMTSVLTGRTHKRPQGWGVAAEIAARPISEDPAYYKNKGAMTYVRSLYRDERRTPGLDAAGFATLRTHVGRSGFYVNNGKMRSAAGSDFDLVQRRRVMDKATKTLRNALLDYLNASALVTETGTINPVDADAIDNAVGAQVSAAVVAPGHASSSSVAVNRTDNVLSTSKLRAKVRIRPLVYWKDIEFEIGFVNPALAPAAA